MIYKFAIVLAIVFIILVLNLVRKNKLDEKYSILWLFFSIIVLIVSIFPSIIEKISEMCDVYYPPALLLLFGIITIVAYIIHITLVITKQNKMIIKLTQEIALLKVDMERRNLKNKCSTSHNIVLSRERNSK